MYFNNNILATQTCSSSEVDFVDPNLDLELAAGSSQSHQKLLPAASSYVFDDPVKNNPVGCGKGPGAHHEIPGLMWLSTNMAL